MASTERLLQEQTKREQAAFERLGKLIDANQKSSWSASQEALFYSFSSLSEI
ncbi:hypothetical protein [Pontibacter sp. SGAir0037]|uniref:hypothetical protein n=1 Tax=Pontibacter sp. SGAir0037 TaxID=2571030 RepID=UPI00143D537E|nr:hypothetical protein [Pontibacter sp. SGAir0037]